MRVVTLTAFVASLPVTLAGQTTLSPAVKEYISVDAPVVALTHVRVIDGTGAPSAADQTIVIANGKIQSVGPATSAKVPTGALVMDLTGSTVIPGIVGLHDHTFMSPLGNSVHLGYSAPRLYLASGVTTIRTTGTAVPYTDLNLKLAIDRGDIPGPHMLITGPY